jgi:tellurite resistance protein
MNVRTQTIARLRDALLQSGRRPSTVMSGAYETLTRANLLSPEETVALKRVDPLAETMFLMMSVDGEVTAQEQDAIRGAIRGLTANLLRSGTINVMLENYAERLKEQSRDERLHEIAEEIAEEPSEAEAAFALAAAIAMADERVDDAENEFINQLAGWFAIDPERANEILDQLEADQGAGG